MAQSASGGLETAAIDCTDPVDELEFSPKTGKRAVYEAWEFTQTGDIVRVRNESHDDVEEHVYTVELDHRGVPERCTCPDYEYRKGPDGAACKHMVAVGVHDAQIEDVAIATDGGVVQQEPTLRTRVPVSGGVLIYQNDDVGRELVGFEDVDDWSDLRSALATRGHDVGAIHHLPELDGGA